LNGNDTTPVRGKETDFRKTVTGAISSVTGCIDDQNQKINSMKVNEENCGTPAAGFGFNAYPQDYSKCNLGFIHGRDADGEKQGVLSTLYFVWKCK